MLLSNSDGSLIVPGGHTDGLVRGHTRVKLQELLCSVLPQMDVAATTYSTCVEACACAISKSQYSVYMGIMGRVIYNMQSNGAHIVGKYPISRVCRLSHKRLDAETAHAQRDEDVEARLKALSDSAKHEASIASSMASSIQTDAAIRCPKCHTQDGITRVTAQMNSGDAGMKTRCLCICGHRWQMS